MWVCRYFIWFVVYSVLGWIWESAYCTVKDRVWRNRGFLYGPACPIYGTGVVIAIATWQLIIAAGITPAWWQIFLFCMVGSAILEYFTHWALEMLFHAYWWDYSNMPLNLNGRICLPASTLFGLAGMLVCYVLYDPTVEITALIPAIAVEALSLVLMAILAADTAITAASLTRFAETASAINASVNAHMDQFVASAVERGSAAASTLSEAAEQVVSTAGQVVAKADELKERGTTAADAFAREREVFAESIRTSRVGEMSAMVRSAMSRVKGIAASTRHPSLPTSDDLRRLLARIHEGL